MFGCGRVGQQQPFAFPLGETVERSASAMRSSSSVWAPASV